MQQIRLPEYSHGAGCGCRISPATLDSILKTTGNSTHYPQLLVGNSSKDDAAAYDVFQAQTGYLETLGTEQGLIARHDFMIECINKLRKRLGGELYQKVIDAFESGYKDQLSSGNYNQHKEWIILLLKNIMIPCIIISYKRNSRKILFRGSPKEVLVHIRQNYCKQ